MHRRTRSTNQLVSAECDCGRLAGTGLYDERPPVENHVESVHGSMPYETLIAGRMEDSSGEVTIAKGYELGGIDTVAFNFCDDEAPPIGATAQPPSALFSREPQVRGGVAHTAELRRLSVTSELEGGRLVFGPTEAPTEPSPGAMYFVNDSNICELRVELGAAGSPRTLAFSTDAARQSTPLGITRGVQGSIEGDLTVTGLLGEGPIAVDFSDDAFIAHVADAYLSGLAAFVKVP